VLALVGVYGVLYTEAVVSVERIALLPRRA
jgi:hypothetical protein